MIVAKPPPPEVIAALESGLRRMAGEGGSAPVSETVVRRTAGLPIVALASSGCEFPRDGPVIGWRFLVFDDGGPLWTDVEDDRLVGILRGGAVDRLLDACAAADGSGIAGSAAILSASAISAEALWVRGDEDCFWPLTNGPAEPVNWPELAARWTRAERASALRDGIEELVVGELS